MNEEKIVKDSSTLYGYFHKILYKTTKRAITKTDEKTLNSFIKNVSKKDSIHFLQIGRNYLLKYTIFQFDYWNGLTIDSYKNGIPLTWIFGGKAIDRWVSRDREYDFTLLSKKFLLENSIDIKINTIFKAESENKTNRNEDIEKLRYEDGSLKLANCIDKTTLYSSKSRTCRKCTMSEKCINILGQLYPSLYKERMEINYHERKA